MKKVFSVITAAILLACTLLPMAVSADVLWTDDFSTMQENDWIWDGDLFFINNGKLEGWAEAVVHQSNFLVDRGAPRRFKECAFKVEASGLEDGGRDSENHGLSLWFADYISPYGSDEPDGQIVYTFGYEFETHKLVLNASFSNAGEDYMPAGAEGSVAMAEYVVPDAEAPVLDTNGESPFTLGMRIRGGVISCFFNDTKVIEATGYRGATTATQLGSPILFVNGGCHCTFDNLVVSTADYNLFNETAGGSAPAAGGNSGGGQSYETVVVTDTDAEGNVVTRVETRPVANNGGAATGGNAAKTGDAAIIVAAVMVVSLGAAIVVRRFCLK